MYWRSVNAATSAVVLAAALGCGAASQTSTVSPEAARAEPKASSPRKWVEVHKREVPEMQEVSAFDGSSSPAPALQPTAAVEPEPERTPTQVLDGMTDPGVVFMVEYKLTEAYRRASESCTAVVGDDEAKRTDCINKLHDQFGADGMRFRQDDDGKLWWVIYQRKGSEGELVETYSARIELGDIGPRSATMTVIGPIKGKRALLKDAQRITLVVPDEYSVEIDDPAFGHLVYDAKMGLVR